MLPALLRELPAEKPVIGVGAEGTTLNQEKRGDHPRSESEEMVEPKKVFGFESSIYLSPALVHLKEGIH